MGERYRLAIAGLFLGAGIGVPASAQDLPEAFEMGPLLPGTGPNAEVPGMTPLPESAAFRVAFDTAKGAADGKPNATLMTAARFLNMHARAGVDPVDLSAAVVIHGGAVADVVKQNKDKPSAELVATLTKHNVRVIVCGQSAASLGVEKEDLLPGVEMALSAITAHALLQQQGYSLNPF
ncbi:MAG: DsrE family protein [Pseudomonadota bacterium]